ncbi:MAG: amino acid permease [Planctomycetota bacterium]|nr:amino acid permease [Planctomycetota bacterium]
MSEANTTQRLKKELSLLSVYAIATGTTLSAGFFLLPGYAYRDAGPAVVLCYLIAGLLMVPAMLCIVELSTAMPRAGGAYYFLDRSLGPLAGTIGGLGTWIALTLKTAFALVGMGYYLGIFFPDAPMTIIATGFALLFGFVNFMGSSKTGVFQIVLVFFLLAILTWFIGLGGMSLENFDNFEGFFAKEKEKSGTIFATAGLVFISYVGVTNMASVSEEVKDPERNIPLGVFAALTTAIIIYVLGVGLMVGFVPGSEWQSAENINTPVATAVNHFAGRPGVIVVSIAAILAFSSVVNGAILSSSRYPLAMGRDHLLPGFFRRINKHGVPVRSIIVTVGAVIAYIWLFDLHTIAELASASQLLMFAVLCGAVIVMRESRIDSYDPGYRSPFYPWLQIIGIIGPLAVIAAMGWLEIAFTFGLVSVGALWYYYYARPRVKRHGAIYHVFERLGRLRYDELDSELRGILKEKGLRDDDPFDVVVARSHVVDAEPSMSFEEIVEVASTRLAERTTHTASELAAKFLEGTRIGATPVSKGVALPHLRMRDVHEPQLAIVRSREGVTISIGEAQITEPIHAMFFLMSPEDDPGQHLRILAQLAGQIEQEGYMAEWLAAKDEQQLKEILLRNDRYFSITLESGKSSEAWIGKKLRDIDFPEDLLVALIRRHQRTVVPKGDTELVVGDRLTIIGDPKGIRQLYERFGSLDLGE